MEKTIPLLMLVQDIQNILKRHRESLSVAEIEALEDAIKLLSQAVAREKQYSYEPVKELISFAIDLLMKFLLEE